MTPRARRSATVRTSTQPRCASNVPGHRRVTLRPSARQAPPPSKNSAKPRRLPCRLHTTRIAWREKSSWSKRGVGKMKAAETLKRLAEKGLLEWVGSNQHDPRQYYRAVAGSSGSYRALPATFGAGSRCRLPPRSATRGAGLQRSSLLSRRERKAGRGFCAGGEDCRQSRWSISSRLGRIGESE